MAKKLLLVGLAAALMAVVGLNISSSGSVALAPQPAAAASLVVATHQASKAQTCAKDVYTPSRAKGQEWDWLHYDADPYYPNLQTVAAMRHALQVKGAQARRMLGIPLRAWSQLARANPCAGWLRYNQKLDRMMSGGFWGTRVQAERNVRAKFSHKPVRAWYLTATYHGKLYILIVPWKCGNLSVVVVPAPPVTTFSVWAWKYAQVGNAYAQGHKLAWQVYARGARRGPQWRIVDNQWSRLGPFRAGHIPTIFCEIVRAPWKALGGACQKVSLVKGKLVVVFHNQSPGKGAPAPLPTPKPAPTPTTPGIVCTQGFVLVGNNCVQQGNNCSAGQIYNGTQCVNINVVCGNVVVGNGNNVSQGGNCNSPAPPPAPPCNCSPPPPTCPSGQTGTPPNCKSPPPPPCNCQPPPPSCPSGQNLENGVCVTPKVTSDNPPPNTNNNGAPTSGGVSGSDNDPPAGAPGTTIPTTTTPDGGVEPADP